LILDPEVEIKTMGPITLMAGRQAQYHSESRGFLRHDYLQSTVTSEVAAGNLPRSYRQSRRRIKAGKSRSDGRPVAYPECDFSHFCIASIGSNVQAPELENHHAEPTDVYGVRRFLHFRGTCRRFHKEKSSFGTIAKVVAALVVGTTISASAVAGLHHGQAAYSYGSSPFFSSNQLGIGFQTALW
jgi:hypothetical protein